MGIHANRKHSRVINCVASLPNKKAALASATLAEKNTNTTKEISLVVFFVETGLHKGSLV